MNGAGGGAARREGLAAPTAAQAADEVITFPDHDATRVVNRRRRAPDLFDVGRRAGVSHQTVSRVVHNHARVREVTRAKVMQAIADLGYRPNTAARTMAGFKTPGIGIVSPASHAYGPSATVLAVERAASSAGFAVNKAIVSLGGTSDLVASLDRLLSQSVDGIIGIAPQDHSVAPVADIADRVTSVVLADVPPGHSFVHSVSIDQVAGADLATTHLLSLGRRRIAHISGPFDWFDSRSRITGWAQSIERAPLPGFPLLQGDWTPENGYRAGLKLIAEGLPDAVFVANDAMALGLLCALNEHGVRVPAEVAVVGFDNISDAAYYHPSLSSVHQDFAALGALAVDTIRRVDSRDPVERCVHKITPTLVSRSSSVDPDGSRL